MEWNFIQLESDLKSIGLVGWLIIDVITVLSCFIQRGINPAWFSWLKATTNNCVTIRNTFCDEDCYSWTGTCRDPSIARFQVELLDFRPRSLHQPKIAPEWPIRHSSWLSGIQGPKSALPASLWPKVERSRVCQYVGFYKLSRKCITLLVCMQLKFC